MSRSISIAHTHTQNERIQIKNDPTSHRADSASRVSKKMRKYRRGEERIQLNLGKSSSLRLQRADKWPLPNTWYARPGRVPFTEKKTKQNNNSNRLTDPTWNKSTWSDPFWPLWSFASPLPGPHRQPYFFSLSLSLSLSLLKISLKFVVFFSSSPFFSFGGSGSFPTCYSTRRFTLKARIVFVCVCVSMCPVFPIKVCGE